MKLVFPYIKNTLYDFTNHTAHVRIKHSSLSIIQNMYWPNFLNDIHPNLKFTKDEALNDCSFPFLNVEVKINDSVFDSWIYRKPTHTNVFLNYKAMAPNSFKRGLILGFLTTAKRLCSSTLYFDQEVSKLRRNIIIIIIILCCI